MKELTIVTRKKEVSDMCQYILVLLRGKNPSLSRMTERFRQYGTWGANSFYLIASKCGCYGLQFNVSGLLHKGRVRIWYNPASDYFDVELLRARKDVCVWSCDDLDFVQLHNVLHQHIERTDDPEV